MQKKSEHYLFNFPEGSEAEKDIDLISKTQEQAYKKITSFINDSNFPVIKYYLYEDRKTKGEVTDNDGNGHADPDKFEVYAVYNKNTKCIGPHEDTHLLTKNMGLPPQLFREGLAEYFSEKWHEKPHLYWAGKFLKENKLYPISSLINNNFWYETDESISYPQSGAFIGFLISEIGKDKFIKLYKQLDNKENSQSNKVLILEITGKIISEWEKKWLSQL